VELKSGYKQTEVGVIPEEWDVVELDDTARVVDSLHQTPSFAEYGFPMVRVTDIKPGNLSFDGTLMVTEAVFADFTRNYKPRRGDIVLSRVGSYGVSSFVETDEPFCMGQNTVVLQPKLPPRFLYYALNSRSIRQQIEDGSYGSGYKSLSLKNIKELRIPVPPTEAEQRAIAGALSDVDELIGSLDQLIAKKRDLKQAAMQQLLTGQTRLPGFHGEWEVKHLRELGSTYGGLTGKTKSDFGDGLARYITFLNIMNNVVIDPEKFEQVRVSPWENQNWAVRGDHFFNGSSETPEEAGMCSVLLTVVQNVFLNSFCFGFRLHDDISANGLYIAYFFRSGEGRKLLYSLAQGATRHNLSKTALMAIAFPLPSLPEQTAIAKVLSDMDVELAALEQRRDKTRALKQGMMQELLTGKTRLISPKDCHA